MAWIKMSPAVLCPALHMSPDRSKQLRVSAAMTNAPMILTNVPETPLRALSYYSGPKTRPKYGSLLSRNRELLFLAKYSVEAHRINIGYRYGSLVEDYFTGLRLHSEGWRSTFCNPDRPAFLGDAPVSLIDLLVQQKRWTVGVLEVVFLKCSLLTFGFRAMGPLAGLGCSMCAFYPIYSIKRSRRSNILTILPED
ncbi:hypothetical protein NC651_000958 [Populus alba x Populus x berolinensis]|nr:hypothetical protein NC651_000958 [Populus alba x Populus x berolinensis]